MPSVVIIICHLSTMTDNQMDSEALRGCLTQGWWRASTMLTKYINLQPVSFYFWRTVIRHQAVWLQAAQPGISRGFKQRKKESVCVFVYDMCIYTCVCVCVCVCTIRVLSAVQLDWRVIKRVMSVRIRLVR